MKRLLSFAVWIFTLIAFHSPVFATLYDIGDGLVYCDTLNVTFLQDANYAATSGYDSDGRMTWDQAKRWADNLNYSGFGDWRLPTAYDVLYGTLPPGGAPDTYDVKGSEMGYLFCDEDLVSFVNMNIWTYWTGTEYSSDGAWDFDFRWGTLGAGIKSDLNYAMAVRHGYSAPIPEPSTILLFCCGLVTLLALTKRNETRHKRCPGSLLKVNIFLGPMHGDLDNEASNRSVGFFGQFGQRPI